MHTPLTLDQIPKNKKAQITAINDRLHPHAELNNIEKRLLEMGFVEGAPVMLLHEAPFSKDPLIVRLRNNRIAIRRSEAKCIEVQLQL
jgi:ferrous iron transport protein A